MAIIILMGGNADARAQEQVNSGGPKPLLAYTREAFPGARISLRIDDSEGTQLLPPQTNASMIGKPAWLRQTGFTGLVADNLQPEIRNLAERKQGQCTTTAVFSFHLAPRWRDFVPGSVAPVAVVMTARDWNTGVAQDWIG